MKKIMTLICCIAIVLGTMVFTKDSTILAASISDTFTEGDFTYEIKDLGTPTTNGKVEIKDYDETSSTTDLTIAETVTYDSKIYDVVSAVGDAFESADKVKTVHISKNFTGFSIEMMPFTKISDADFTISSSLESITVDEGNPTLKVIDGVLYNMTSGREEISLYPFNGSKTEYVVPEFIMNSAVVHATDNLLSLQAAPYLESIVIPYEDPRGYIYTENGMLCAWVDKYDHTKGAGVHMIPQAMKKIVFSKDITGIRFLEEGMYAFLENEATEYVVEENSKFRSIDGCLYQGDTMIVYPGGRSESVYKIPEGTDVVGGFGPTFYANRNLKSLIIPSSVTEIGKQGLLSGTLTSIKIEGTGNITWNSNNFNNLMGEKLQYHIYVDNGNTTIKTQLQASFSHLTDEYFHELGAVPTTSITNVKTSIENTKDVKVSWTASKANKNYEVRRYTTDGKYKVVGSTTDTSFIDTTTEYNTTYQYEVVPYSLPVTSSNVKEDAFREYHTYGTASNKESVTTPVQKFKGTYTYKLADGTQGSITKDIKKGESVVNNAPALPEVKGYVFDKWTSDLLNIEVVDKDFTATAIYKKVDAPVDNDKPDNDKSDNNNPDISKPSNDEKTPSDTKDTVKTGDQVNIIIPMTLLIITGTILTVVTRKKHEE